MWQEGEKLFFLFKSNVSHCIGLSFEHSLDKFFYLFFCFAFWYPTFFKYFDKDKVNIVENWL